MIQYDGELAALKADASKDVDARKGAPLAALDITVLAGGVGPEREVSLNSGAMVSAALARLGHCVETRDIAPDELSALDREADVVFVALHGEFGEDGAVQRILEQRGVTYTGSDAVASALAMDKIATKAKFIEADVPTPTFDVVKHGRVNAVVDSASLPVVVKPCGSGSSVDTWIVKDRNALREALDAVVGRYGAALVEHYIRGPELTVSILGEAALPVCQIRTKREFYNYQAKYIDDDTEYLFDIDLPAELLTRIQEMSLRAFKAVGCRDFARVDWMVDERTLQPCAIEINTIPGLTSHSLLPKAAARVGIGFDALCESVARMAMARKG